MKSKILAATVCLFLGACTSEAEGPIRIGAVISSSGPQRQHLTVTRGMTMAADEINELGGINGRRVEIVVTDAASSLEKAREGFAALEADSAPVAYVTASSGMAMELAPLAGEHEVLLIGLMATTPDFTQSNRWCFRYWTSSELLVPPLLRILKEIRAKEIAVLYQDDQLGNSVLDAMRSAVEERGVRIEPVPFGVREKDLAPYIAELAGSEAVYVVGFSGGTVNALREIRLQNYQGHVITFSSGSTPAVRSMPEANGIYTVSSRIYDRRFPFAREVRDRYEKRFGDPFEHRVASGYDAVKLLAAHAGRVAGGGREALRASLSGGFIYPGVFGDIEVSSGDRDFLLPMEAARIRDGEVVFLE